MEMEQWEALRKEKAEAVAKKALERLDALCMEIIEAKQNKALGTINMEQCSVLVEVAACIRNYVDLWIRLCGEEAVWLLTKVMEELSTVLKRGLELIKLCDGTDVFVFLGTRGQFTEIIEDSMCYIEMVKKVFHHGHFTGEELYRNVKSGPFDIKWASLEDKDTLIRIIKSQPGDSRSVGSMLETGLYPEIEENELYLEEQTRGSGSFGMITFGKWRGLPIAVKGFHLDNYFNDELKVFNELLNAGSNPHVVQMFGYTRKNKLVLEQMDTDLKKIIEERRPLLHSVDIMHQIAKGMTYLHKNNVVHRDLKPANVLVKVRNQESPLIKVTDFGISKDSFDSATSNTECRGTLFYMAPEILKGPNYTRKVDVYSFGLICKEMLAQKLRQTRTEKLEFPPEIHPKFVALIDSCLENDARRRPDFEAICSRLCLVKKKILITRKRVQSRLEVMRHLHIEIDLFFTTSFEFDLVVLTGVLENVERSGALKSVLEKIKNVNPQCKSKKVYLGIGESDILPEVYSCAEARTPFANSVVDLMMHAPLVFTGIFIDAGENTDKWVAALHKIRETSVAVAPFKIAISCPMFPRITWPTEPTLHVADEIYVYSSDSDSYNTMSELVDKYVKLGVPPSKIFIDRRQSCEISLDEANYIAEKKLGGLVRQCTDKMCSNNLAACATIIMKRKEGRIFLRRTTKAASRRTCDHKYKRKKQTSTWAEAREHHGPD